MDSIQNKVNVTKSFAAVVGNNRSEQIELKTPSTYKGEPAMFFTEEDIASLASLINSLLLGNFLIEGHPYLRFVLQLLRLV